MSRKRPPFFNWRQAILESPLPATTKHVLLTLACHMNDAGESCYPSIARLCAETSLSNRAVITHLRLAKEKGWISVRQGNLAGREWATNAYAIAWPAELEGSEPGSLPKAGEAVNDVHHVRENGSERRSPPQGDLVVNHVHHPDPHGSERHDVGAVNVVHPSTSVSTSVKKTTLSSSSRSSTERAIAQALLEELNRRTFKQPGRGFQPTESNLRLIIQRLRESDAETVLRVIIRKVLQWWNTDQEDYLTPKTLFSATNFATYSGQIGSKLRRKDGRKLEDVFTREQLDIITPIPDVWKTHVGAA